MHRKRTAKEVLEMAAREGAKLLDCKLIDWPGVLQHATFPMHEFDESTFEDGLGFDRSSEELGPDALPEVDDDGDEAADEQEDIESWIRENLAASDAQ